MIINAVVDRIEDGNVILLTEDIGLEISIPAKLITGKCSKGETLSLTIDDTVKEINPLDEVNG